jgi:hypothetical protein
MSSTSPSKTWISAANWRIYFDEKKRFVVESWESVKDQVSFKLNSLDQRVIPETYTPSLLAKCITQVETSEMGKILFMTFPISDTKVVKCDPKRKYRHKKYTVQTTNEIKD